jgi:predicted DNA-binding transcriptional regulator AlpA
LPLTLFIDPASVTRLLELFREALETTLAKALAQTKASSAPPPAPQPVERASPVESAGLGLKKPELAQAADLRIALLTGKIPEDTGLMIDVTTFAKLLNISARHLYRLRDEQAIPDPIRLGRLIRWRLGEILEWIEADCPPQRIWLQKRRAFSATALS